MTITSAAVVIDDSGVSAPTFDEIIEYLKAKYRGIYGNDVYLENDSQDGQFLGVLARCISEVNAGAISVYNSMSPATAVGEALSRNVRLNGIDRGETSHSSVTVKLIGVAGTTITSGVVGDSSENRWLLPSTVTIGSSGEVSVTATAEKEGAIISPANTINKILTPTRGWQTVNNLASATVGAPVEKDGQLRQRQAVSVSIPSQSLPEGLTGALLGLTGVTRCKVYENFDATTNALGIPARTIAAVVAGGSTASIGQTILYKRSMGCNMAGNTTHNFTDRYGQAVSAKFYRPNTIAITVNLNLTVSAGYSETIGNQIKQSIADYINSLGIGAKISVTKLYAVIGISSTFEIDSLEISNGTITSTDEIQLGFRDIASCSTSDISVGVNQ